MNITQQGIIALLKSAITRKACPLPDGFTMEEALPLIQKHGIITLVYDGAVRCGISKQEPAMQILFQQYLRYMMKSEGQMAAVSKLFTAFDQAGIAYMPLKGCRMKALYPSPELRTMGDADVLIRMEEYDRIRPIMEGLGYQEGADTDHELVWENRALFLELHKRLIPSYNKDFYAYFGDGWQLATVQDGSRFRMRLEDEFIYLFTHFAKHFRDGGIGCRHVTDLWVFLRSYPEMDMDYVNRQMESLELDGFYRNVRQLLAVWFEDSPMDDKSLTITELVFSSGSFGENTMRVVSLAVRDAGRDTKGGRLLYLWQTAFPGVNVLKHKYRVLQKAPWLLPVVWLVRPFYKLMFERKSLKKQEENLQALSPEMMKMRRETLEYLELEYRF